MRIVRHMTHRTRLYTQLTRRLRYSPFLLENLPLASLIGRHRMQSVEPALTDNKPCASLPLGR
jgi:hypothetical protein